MKLNKNTISDPRTFWENLSRRKNWREFILPKRNDEEFWREGQEQAVELMSVVRKNDSTILSYGCGIGRVIKYMECSGRRIGIDVSLKMIERAKFMADDPGIDFYTVDSCPDIKADFIFCLSVMQHNTIENRKEIIENIYRLLSPGGMCVVSFPIKGAVEYHESPFVHLFDKSEITDLAGSLFVTTTIMKGNLVRYARHEPRGKNELFLIGIK